MAEPSREGKRDGQRPKATRGRNTMCPMQMVEGRSASRGLAKEGSVQQTMAELSVGGQ